MQNKVIKAKQLLNQFAKDLENSKLLINQQALKEIETEISKFKFRGNKMIYEGIEITEITVSLCLTQFITKIRTIKDSKITKRKDVIEQLIDEFEEKIIKIQ